MPLPPDIALPTTAWCDRPLAAALDQVAELAVFADIYSAFDHSLLHAHNREAALASGLRLSVHGPWDGADIGSPDDRRRREAVAVHAAHLAAAAEVGAVVYVVHPDYSRAPRGRDERIREALQRSVADLEVLQAETGVTVTVENLAGADHSHFAAPGDLELGGLGLTLDTGHAAASGSLDAFLREPRARLAHIHLHDHPGTPGEDPHLALGRGIVPVADVISVARDAGATIVLELLLPEDVLASVAFLRATGLVPFEAIPSNG